MAAEDYSFNLDDESEETVSLCDLSGSSEGDLDSDSSRISEIARLMSINKGRNYVEKHEMKKMFPDLASKKSRSHSYGIELAGSRPEMDFSAIKSRQNRHRKSNLDGGRKEATGSFRQENWLDRLIKGLSCNYETEASSMKVILDQLP
ncbi:hypothetical protein E3N88_38281 [Mikania micrantha]|uniref:Uncharacterized protein n=1 Tax=Mikania micrantha TaxID=192012 RepID=A0A5N6LTJ2_9ASTR|nr:hypothetical protein E3N88_38281 [Mikania micrantha]